MTSKDINDLFDLLGLYYSGHPGLSVKNIRAAWLSVLEPYSRETVKKAVLEYLRVNTNFPRPQEIAVLCPPLPVTPVEQSSRTMGPVGPMDAKAKEEQNRLFARMIAERDRLSPLRRAAGIPATAEEAKTAGMTATEWWNQCERAGLNYPDSVWGEEAVADGTA